MPLLPPANKVDHRAALIRAQHRQCHRQKFVQGLTRVNRAGARMITQALASADTTKHREETPHQLNVETHKQVAW